MSYNLGKEHLPLTFFIDIDGTLLKHQGTMSKMILNQPKILPGVLKKLDEISGSGGKIILVTGRPESARKKTEEQLSSLGIHYNQLVMDVGIGSRVLINDLSDKNDKSTAYAISVKRNTGLADISHH